MRLWWVAFFLLLLVLPAVQPASAQAAPVRVLDDPAGDAKVALGGQGGQPAPADSANELDLVSLSVSETKTDFAFILGIKGFTGDTGLAGQVSAYFMHNDARFQVVGTTRNWNGAYLSVYDEARGRYVPMASVPQELDEAAATVSIKVPRTLLVDSEGAAPFPGRTLTGFWSEAWTFRWGDFNTNGQRVTVLELADRMPDSGNGTVNVQVKLGLVQTGSALLTSNMPFRSSNGEATTFVFRINATNRGEAEDSFILSAVDVPTGWEARLPSSTVRLGPGERIELPVVVHTAFSHKHGTSAAFLVEMESATDAASVGRVELGLRYAQPPQPAGHHNTVWLHSINAIDGDAARDALGDVFTIVSGHDWRKWSYMNAEKDDPLDAKVAVPGQQCGGELPLGTEYCWFIGLEPRLELGLDFDLGAGPGKLLIPIHSFSPMPGARVEGTLWYVYTSPDVDEFGREQHNQVELARIEPSDTVEMGPDATLDFDLKVVPLPESDLVPWRKEAYLYLELRMATNRPDNPMFGPHLEPELLPGGEMQLPLLEYADPLTGILFGAGTAVLEVTGPAQKLVNPGKTAVFNLTLSNSGDLEETFRMGVVGTHPEWADLTESGDLVVPAHESRTFQVVIAVPEGASDGESADLVVEAASVHDVALRTLTNVMATADTDEDHADESGLASTDAGKGAPGPAFALLLLVVAFAALARRK